MPVGPYDTFGECVAAQKKKGKSDLAARKICGTIEKNMAAETMLEALDRNDRERSG